MGNILCCCNENRVADQEPIVPAIQAETGSTVGKLLIFVNPNSGSGLGLKTFQSKVQPELHKNKIDYELITTTGPNHAKGIVALRENILNFNGIMILSGDGLVFEIINGICERVDAENVLQNLPIAIIPSGSGNGLLASLFASHGWSLKSPSFIKKAIEIATSSNATAQPINIFHVQTPTENIGAFLSLGWGLMADIDIESEKYRKTLGSNRFVVSALVRCMNMRTYKGRLSYKEYAPSQAISAAPYSVYCSRERCIQAECLPNVTAEKEGRQNDDFWSISNSTNPPVVEEQVPQDWVSIEDDFIGVYAMANSHIAADGHFMPGAKLDDDRLYLSYILRRDIKSKTQLVKMLLAIEEGKHVDLPYFKTVQVSAFRLEPTDTDSLLVVDGEVVDAPVIQASTSNLRTFIFS